MTIDLPDHRLLSAADETALALRIQAGDETARNELIACNLKLVMARVHWYARRSPAEADELFQEGCLGLIRAAEKYDPSRGTRFSTVATWWIDQALGRYLDDHATLIRVPVGLRQTLRAQYRTEQTLTAVLGREPTFDEVLAATTGKAPHPALAQAAHNATHAITSLDQPAPSLDGDGVALAEFLAGPDDIEADALRRAAQRELAMVLHLTLPARERWIIERRFGFHDGHCWTLEACGKELHLSRERVRQLQQRALRRLRRVMGRTDDHRRSA